MPSKRPRVAMLARCNLKQCAIDRRSLSLRHVDRVIGNARMRVGSGAREQRTEGADGRRRAEQVSTLRTSERKCM